MVTDIGIYRLTLIPPTELIYLNFHPLEVVSRYRDPQLQVAENYANLVNLMTGSGLNVMARILVQVTIYRRLLIRRDGHLDQSEAYDIS